MKQIYLKFSMLLLCLVVGLSSWGEEYSFTIQTSDFNTTSYAANNGSHDFTATCKTDASKTMTVACTSNQVMQSSSVMQWQKSNGYIYNTTDLGSIKSVTVNSSAGSFTTYYGTTENPNSDTQVGGGYFNVKVGNATGKTSSIVVVFDPSESGSAETFSITLADNSTTIEQQTAGANVTLPTRDGNDTYTFIGWSTTNLENEITTSPEIIKSGLYKPEKNLTLYPIYKRVEEGSVVSVTSNSLSGKKSVDQALDSKNIVYYKISSANDYENPLRIYSNNTLTISCAPGYKLTKVILEGESTNYPLTNLTLTSKDGEIKEKTSSKLVWEGESSNITFKASAQARVSKISAEYTKGNVVYYTSKLPAIVPLTAIRITTPTKTLYKVGETFSTEGMIVTASYDGADDKPVTSYTISKTTGLSTEDNTITITYTENNITKTTAVNIDVIALDKISIITPPTKTEYVEEQYFDAAGMVVMATWGTEEGKMISEEVEVIVNNGNALAAGMNSVELSYTHEGITKTTSQEISVTAIPTYIVTIEVPENGTLKVKVGEKEITNGAEVKDGAVLTIIPDPAEGYVCKNWQYKEDGGSWVSTWKNYEYTIKGKNVSFRANFDELPKYTVTFSINGEKTKLTEEIYGAGVTPPTVESVDDYEFYGWVTSTTNSEVTDKPEVVNINDVYKPESDITLYALYRKSEGEGEDGNAHDYVITENINGFPTDKYYSDGYQIYVDNQYFGLNNVAYFPKYDNTTMQFAKNYGTIYNSSALNISTVTVVYKEGSAQGLTVYSGNECMPLSNPNMGNKTGNTTTFTVNADYFTLKDETSEPIYVKSITISCGSPSIVTYYYTTSLPSPLVFTPQTLTFKAQDEEELYYATFSSPSVTFFPNDVTVNTVVVENGSLVMLSGEDEVFAEDIVTIEDNTIDGFYVPANTGILIYSTDEQATYYTVSNKTVEAVDPDFNMLKPASETMSGDNKFYKLAYGNYTEKTGLGFYWGAENGGGFICKDGTAYLAVPNTKATKSFVFGESATSIKSISSALDANAPIYNLTGQHVNSSAKGILIQNGKKYINK